MTTFVLRTIAGALSASIYLSAVTTRCLGKTKTLPLFTVSAFITLVFVSRRMALPNEVLACAWSVLYGLVVLTLTQLIFIDKLSESIDGTSIARRNLQPLAFLTGAKLLTILCYNLPFACIAMQYFHLLATSSHHVDASKSFNHLIIFICTRCILGIFTIFDDTNKHEMNAYAVVNHLSTAIYLTVLMCATMVTLLLLLNEEMMNCVNEYLVRNEYEFCAGVLVSGAYAVLSVYIDSIGHSAMISATSIFSFGKRSQSIVFASCIEHLIDVGFTVIHLSQLVDTRLILIAMCFCGMSIGIQTILQCMTVAATNADRFAPLNFFLKLEII